MLVYANGAKPPFLLWVTKKYLCLFCFWDNQDRWYWVKWTNGLEIKWFTLLLASKSCVGCLLQEATTISMLFSAASDYGIVTITVSTLPLGQSKEASSSLILIEATVCEPYLLLLKLMWANELLFGKVGPDSYVAMAPCFPRWQKLLLCSWVSKATAITYAGRENVVSCCANLAPPVWKAQDGVDHMQVSVWWLLCHHSNGMNRVTRKIPLLD